MLWWSTSGQCAHHDGTGKLPLALVRRTAWSAGLGGGCLSKNTMRFSFRATSSSPLWLLAAAKCAAACAAGGGSSCLDKPPLSWVASLTANAGPAPRAHPRRRAASSKCRLSVLSRTLRREWTAPGALSDVPLGVCCSGKKLSCASSVGAMAQSQAAGRDGARNRAYQTLGPSNARRRGGFRPNCNSSGGAVVVEVGAQLWGSTLSGELMLLLLCRYLPSTSRVNFELDIRIRQKKSLRSPVSSLLRILFVPCRNPRSISSPVGWNRDKEAAKKPSTAPPGEVFHPRPPNPDPAEPAYMLRRVTSG